MENSDYIQKLVDEIIDGDNTSAKDTFGDLMSGKIHDALDTKKKEVAQSIYNNEPVEEEETE